MKPIKKHKIILFDGVCNLCNSSVQFIIKHDNNDCFRFASLQSNFAKKVIKNYNASNLDSILLLTPEHKVYSESTAILKISSDLGFPISMLQVFLIIPKPIRDWVYRYIALNRYNWFGKKETCWIPTPELENKFIKDNF